MTRSESRELSFAIGFERLISRETVDDVIEGAAEARSVTVSAFARKLAKGVEENEKEIDAILKNSLKGWQLSRISNVAHAILQIAIYEMIHEESVPLRVSINEAVELSKKYGDTEDAKFVNGVLASVTKEMERQDG
ncbi:MAG: transcription antitermination factor NusB [Clostridia bacterium]|nr:transcription antitermination factor NusB [Clostridia bacterium]